MFASILSDKDKLKVKKLKEDGCRVTLEVQVPAARVQETNHTVWLQIQTQARLPGFRPGKAPLPLVQRQFAQEAKERVLHQLIQKTVPEAVGEAKLKPIVSPAVHGIRMEDGQPLVFQVDVECAPKFELKGYKKLALTQKRYPATEEEVSKRLDDLREGNARLEAFPGDAAEKDHYLVVDYQGFADGKPLKESKGSDELIDLSSPQTVEGLAEGLLGAKRGETRDVPVEANKRKMILRVIVKEIKSKAMPALDDAFAKDLGFETLEDLRKNLKELIEREGRQKTERETIQQIEEGLLKTNPFPVPAQLVEQQLERLTQRVQEQWIGPKGELPEAEQKKLQEKLAPRAEAEVRLSFLLDAIATAEKIEVTDADLEAELQKSLPEAASEDQKKGLRKLFADRAAEIRGLIRERKVMALLKESAVIASE